ncbi:MAG: glycosyltransferase [Chitinophagaceae bacterium]
MLVSVWITTYNHEKYIAQAIEGVLSQVTDFDYEIIIGEDCSQDSTRAIVMAYKEKYPDKINLFLPPQNLGMNPMFHQTYAMCKGKYLAWLDGDDYWTSNHKLQQQVDYLESHPEVVMCFHRVDMINEISNTLYESGDPLMGADSILTEDHFLDAINPVYTPSVVHRNILSKELPSWFFKLPFPDLGFYFLLLQHGKIKFLSENMGAYRIHRAGAFQGNSHYNNVNKFIVFFETFFAHAAGSNKNKVSLAICKLSLQALFTNLKNGNYLEVKKNLSSLRYHRFRGIIRHEWLLVRSALLLVFKYPFMVIRASGSPVHPEELVKV